MTTLTPQRRPATAWPQRHRMIAVQQTFDELGTPLREVTFVVVDLETTGGSAAGGSSITEIGAVKVRGGEVLGEFQTLVRPSDADPAVHQRADRHHQPDGRRRPDRSTRRCRRSSSSPPGSVLVAHNAPFDVGFLRHFADALGIALATLPGARHREAGPPRRHPRRRAELQAVLAGPALPRRRRPRTTGLLSDARATVDVLARPDGAARQPRRAHPRGAADVLVAGLRRPSARSAISPSSCRTSPGSTCSATRATRCSTSAPPRTCAAGSAPTSPRARPGPGWARWSAWPTSVEAITCTTPLEAEVRELRLIAEHKPRYNRRSKFPERATWLKVTVEPWPRLSLVSAGARRRRRLPRAFPLPAGGAWTAMAALHESFPIRQCGGRFPRQPHRSACALAEMGKCLSPCDGTARPWTPTPVVVDRLRHAMAESPRRGRPGACGRRMARLADVRAVRGGDAASATGWSASSGRPPAPNGCPPLTSCPEIVAARRNDDRAVGGARRPVRAARVAPAVIPAGRRRPAWTDGAHGRARRRCCPGTDRPRRPRRRSPRRSCAGWSCRGSAWSHVDGEWSCPLGGRRVPP